MGRIVKSPPLEPEGEVVKGKPRIEVREYATRKLVRTIPLSSGSPRAAEKVLLGLLRKLDTDKYYAVEKCLDKGSC